MSFIDQELCFLRARMSRHIVWKQFGFYDCELARWELNSPLLGW